MGLFRWHVLNSSFRIPATTPRFLNQPLFFSWRCIFSFPSAPLECGAWRHPKAQEVSEQSPGEERSDSPHSKCDGTVNVNINLTLFKCFFPERPVVEPPRLQSPDKLSQLHSLLPAQGTSGLLIWEDVSLWVEPRSTHGRPQTPGQRTQSHSQLQTTIKKTFHIIWSRTLTAWDSSKRSQALSIWKIIILFFLQLSCRSINLWRT